MLMQVWYANYVTGSTLSDAYELLVAIKNRTPFHLQSDENGDPQETSEVPLEVLEQQARDKFGQIEPFVKAGQLPRHVDEGERKKGMYLIKNLILIL